MMYSDNELSIIMLCMKRRDGENSDVQPLNTEEWSTFMHRLIEHKMEPSILLSSFQKDIKEIGYDEEFLRRLNVLSKRGALAAMDIDDNSRKGITVLTCTSKDYPVLLRRALGSCAPAVIQYVGEIELAKLMGVIFVADREHHLKSAVWAEKIMKYIDDKLVNVYAEGYIGPESRVNIGYYNSNLSDVIKKKDIVKRLVSGKSLIIKTDVESTNSLTNLSYAWAAAYRRVVYGDKESAIKDFMLPTKDKDNVILWKNLPEDISQAASLIY